ncbi:MAG: nuclear transport factor 2 family protein [Bdellovibrionales bacterium]|nr:nuclear transport factor 2 family protein [Bdellovibrionales bacterium]
MASTGPAGRSADAEIEAIRKLFVAINRGAVEDARGLLHSDVERIEPEGYATAGVHRGADSVLAQIAKGRSTWAEGSCDPERFVVAGEKIVACLHARVRLKDKTDWIDGRFADGFVFRDGKIAFMRTFWETREALEWAEVSE